MSTILVIEDTQDNFDLIEDALEAVHNVVHAATGQEGLDKASSLKPDLILLDIALPDIVGYDVARTLKADPVLSSIPLVAITAHAMAGDRTKCLDAGCDDYMDKPVHVKSLVALVTRNLNKVTPVDNSSSGRLFIET